MNTVPKLRKRPAEERGRAEFSWLKARFTFSFGEYYDPEYMGFRSLRVMNNDTIAPGGGFPTHPHRDAEIFTYVIGGQLEHRDSMGNGSIITSGNLQYMSAGSGVRHSEFNPSRENPTRLYQVWLMPNVTGGEPRYAEKPLGDAAKADALTLIFSGEEKEGVTQIRQNAEISFGKLTDGKTLDVKVGLPHAWIQVINGELEVLGETLGEADGLAIENAPETFQITAKQDSEFLFFSLS